MINFLRSSVFRWFAVGLGLIGLRGASGENLNIGSFPYRMYGEAELGFLPRANCMAFDRAGHLYFGDSGGIFRFDGVHWMRIPGLSGDVQSVALSPDGTIFYGQYSGFGYLEALPDGRFASVSLSERLPGAGEGDLRVTSVLAGANFVYFMTLSELIVYEREENTLKRYSLPERFSSNPVIFRDRLLVGSVDRKLWSFGDGAFAIDFDLGKLKGGSPALRVSNRLDGSVFGMLSDGRVFTFDGKHLKIGIRFPNFDPLSGTNLFEMANGNYVAVDNNDIDLYGPDLATRLRRLDLIVSDFPVFVLTSEVSPDRRYLWMSTNSQLARMDLQSPTSRYANSHGLSAPVVRAIRSGGVLYADTGREIMFQRTDKGWFEGRFDVVQGTRNKATQLLGASPEGVYVLIDDRLFHVENGELNTVSDVETEGGLDRLVAPGVAEIVIYEKGAAGWEKAGETLSVGSLIEAVREDGDGSIWVETGLGKMGRVEKAGGVYRVRSFGREDGLPSQRVRTCELDGSVYFLAGNEVLRFDAAADRFVPEPKYGGLARAVGEPRALWQDAEGRYWGSSRSELGIVRTSANGTMYLDTEPLDRFQDFSPNLLLVEAEQMWFSSEVGLLQCETTKLTTDSNQIAAAIVRVEKIGDGTVLNDYISATSQAKLDFGDNSVRVYLGVTDRNRTQGLEFRHRVEAHLPWSDWSRQASVELIGLSPGAHEFAVQARANPDAVSEPAVFMFSIAPPFYRSPLGYAMFALAALGTVGLSGSFIARRHKARSVELEREVSERTSQLEEKTSNLSLTLEELQIAQSRLLDAARMAGMAEIAINVLHTVGNSMNSLTVAVSMLTDKVSRSKLESFGKAVELIDRNRLDLPRFLSSDERGSRLPEYLNELRAVLDEERSFYLEELEAISGHLTQVASIVANQQKNAGATGLIEKFELRDTLAGALRVSITERWRQYIKTEIAMPSSIVLEHDQYKLMQALTVCIKNASESIMEAKRTDGLIRIEASLAAARGCARILVTDNGLGIEPDLIDQVFTMSFTTKKSGSGLGVHSAANTLKSLGGSLSAWSDGLGKGATFCIEFPVNAVAARAKADNPVAGAPRAV